DFTSILSLLAAQPEATAGPIKREVLEKSPEACRCALKQDAQDAVALQFMAKHLAAQGKEAEAIEILERCLKASPQQAEARRLLLRVKRHTLDKPALIAERLKAADELMERGEHEAALSELEFVLRLGARSATTLAKIGGCCVALGRLAEGEAHLDTAAALDFACPEARFYRGSLLAKRQRLSEAIAEMEGARDAAVAGSALAEKASALLRETHAAKGRADYFDGHLEAARKHYEESLKGAEEPPPDAVLRLARIDELTGQHGSAAGRWRLAAASGDAEAEWRAEVNALAAQRQPDPLAQAVTICLSHQRADLAREILDKVGRVKLDRKVRAQINKQLDKLDEPCRKGLADLRADNFGEAANHYKEALRLFPNAQEPLWRLGFVHAEISSWRQSTAKDEELATARKFLTAAVELDPTSETAQNARNKLRQIAVA
ncbi:MAG: tetratricopeptide repeat protein, partial [Planctomycetes bacterium]|nr:tetratricopeptide repeat protein [Planctomycetota bacterium]